MMEKVETDEKATGDNSGGTSSHVAEETETEAADKATAAAAASADYEVQFLKGTFAKIDTKEVRWCWDKGVEFEMECSAASFSVPPPCLTMKTWHQCIRLRQTRLVDLSGRVHHASAAH
jgi:hypothetical protein